MDHFVGAVIIKQLDTDEEVVNRGHPSEDEWAKALVFLESIKFH